MVLLYSSTDIATARRKSSFNLSERPDFHRIDKLSIPVPSFPLRISISLSIDGTLLPRYLKWSTNFRDFATGCDG